MISALRSNADCGRLGDALACGNRLCAFRIQLRQVAGQSVKARANV